MSAPFFANDNRAPRRYAGGLHIAFISACVGRKPTFEGHRLVVQVQVHGRVVDASSFVQVDVEGRRSVFSIKAVCTPVGENGVCEELGVMAAFICRVFQRVLT